MKRLAAAGTFSLLAGLFALLLFAAIFYSCRQGGRPHEMGTSSASEAAVQTVPAVSPTDAPARPAVRSA